VQSQTSGGATDLREEYQDQKMEHSRLLKASEELLFSPEFKELEAKLAFPEPNIWQILAISRKEALVTRFLAWLLNPQGQHSFGSRFLRNEN